MSWAMVKDGLKLPEEWDMKSRCLPDWGAVTNKLIGDFSKFTEKCNRAGLKPLRTLAAPPKWLLRRYLDWRKIHREVVKEKEVATWLQKFGIRDLAAVPVDKLNREIMLI